jgi:hypothetical protein
MADTGGASAGEIGGVLAGGVAILGLVGGGLKWLAGWAIKRDETRAARNARWEAELDEREKALEIKLADSLAQCERHCADIQAKFDNLFDESRVMRVVIELVLPQLEQFAPASPTIELARKMLAGIFKLREPTPADITAHIVTLDRPAP